MNREQKAAVVAELSEQIEAAEAIFAVDYRGISVAEAAELRAKLRDAGTRFRVVKNSLTERATDNAGADTLRSLLEGPTALAFVSGDAALAAKALNDAARNLGTLEFKGGLMDGSPLSAEDIRSIARLPAREVLHGQLVGTIAAPLSGLVRTLNALIASVAIQLKQIADQGLVSGEAQSEDGAVGPESEAEGEPTSGAAAQDEAIPEAEAVADSSEADSLEAERSQEDAQESPGAEEKTSGHESEDTGNGTDASDGEAEASKEEQ